MPSLDTALELNEYRLVLVKSGSRSIWTQRIGDDFRLPRIEVARWTRQAQQLQKSIADVWSLRAFVLDEWLCSENFTCPSQLAIFGGSNSGLLAVAAMTQRPDLFQAILSIAPLLDMVRYERFDQAAKWRGEYGSVENEQEFQALYAYSPYQRVREDVNYPAMLFVTGDRDDRCNPAHVRKMAARLQARPAQSNPILVDYSRERGHSPALPLSVRVEALARRLAFLCRELGIEVPSEDLNEVADC